jgi:HD-like signal output (HDOD) protein
MPAVMDRFFSNPAALPTMPELATRLLRSLARDDLSLNELAALIGRDASLSAKMLRLVNSVRFSPAQPVRGLREAAQLIGLRALRDMALGSCMAGMFPAQRGFDRARFWRHSLATAGHARVLSRLASLDDEAAFLAGLVLRTGRLLMLMTEPESVARTEALADAPDTLCLHERALIGCDHTQVSAELARRWKFPADLCEALSATPDPLAAAPFSPLGAVLRLAATLADCGDLEVAELPTLQALHGDLLARLKLDPATMADELLPFDALTLGADQLLG